MDGAWILNDLVNTIYSLGVYIFKKEVAAALTILAIFGALEIMNVVAHKSFFLKAIVFVARLLVILWLCVMIIRYFNMLF